MELVEVLKNLFENKFTGINQLKFTPLSTDNPKRIKYFFEYDHVSVEMEAERVSIGGLGEGLEMELIFSALIRRKPGLEELNLRIAEKEALWEKEKCEFKQFVTYNTDLFRDGFICNGTYDERLYLIFLQSGFAIWENKEIISVTDFIYRYLGIAA